MSYKRSASSVKAKGGGIAVAASAVVLLGLLAFAALNGRESGCIPSFDKSVRVADGYHVLIIEESDDSGRSALTSGQRDVMLSNAPDSVKEYVRSKGGEFLLLDDDDDVSLSADWVKELWRLDHSPSPWIIYAANGRAYSSALPPTATTQTTIKALQAGGMK